jgi:putative phosphoribosyl transferase
MLYCNRTHAGEELADALRQRAIHRPLVVGLNRGGVLVAVSVARALRAELGYVAAMSLRAPWNPEVAVGAITADGLAYMEQAILRMESVDKDYLAAEKTKQASLARQREKRFGAQRATYKGRLVILVDDGIATGATAIAAIRSLRAAGAARVILATPVALPSSLSQIRSEAEVICLSEDPQLFAVGEAYGDFQPIDDAELEAVLRAYRAFAEACAGSSPKLDSPPKAADLHAIWEASPRRTIDWFEQASAAATRLSRS